MAVAELQMVEVPVHLEVVVDSRVEVVLVEPGTESRHSTRQVGALPRVVGSCSLPGPAAAVQVAVVESPANNYRKVVGQDIRLVAVVGAVADPNFQTEALGPKSRWIHKDSVQPERRQCLQEQTALDRRRISDWLHLSIRQQANFGVKTDFPRLHQCYFFVSIPILDTPSNFPAWLVQSLCALQECNRDLLPLRRVVDGRNLPVDLFRP